MEFCKGTVCRVFAGNDGGFFHFLIFHDSDTVMTRDFSCVGSGFGDLKLIQFRGPLLKKNPTVHKIRAMKVSILERLTLSSFKVNLLTA